MVVALTMLVALTLTVFMTMDTTLTDSRMMRYAREYQDNFYRAETGLSYSIERHQDFWLTINSPLFDPTSAFADAEDAEMNEDIEIIDESDTVIQLGTYRVARIEANPESGFLSDQFLKMPHRAGPPIGSGYSVSQPTRRYGIQSTGSGDGSNRSVTLEVGVFKVFHAG